MEHGIYYCHICRRETGEEYAKTPIMSFLVLALLTGGLYLLFLPFLMVHKRNQPRKYGVCGTTYSMIKLR